MCEKETYIRCQTVEKDGITLPICQITAKVFDTPVTASVFQLVVEPPQENLFGGFVEHVGHFLAFTEQPQKLWVFFKGNGAHQLDADDLPNKSEHKDGAAIDEVNGTHVDDSAPNRFGGVDDKVLVFDLVQKRGWDDGEA
jgi:hypothetical protein